MVATLICEEFGDVTLACDKEQIGAHRMKQTYAQLMKLIPKNVGQCGPEEGDIP